MTLRKCQLLRSAGLSIKKNPRSHTHESKRLPRGGGFYWRWPEVSMTLPRSSRPNYYRPFSLPPAASRLSVSSHMALITIKHLPWFPRGRLPFIRHSFVFWSRLLFLPLGSSSGHILFLIFASLHGWSFFIDLSGYWNWNRWTEAVMARLLFRSPRTPWTQSRFISFSLHWNMVLRFLLATRAAVSFISATWQPRYSFPSLYFMNIYLYTYEQWKERACLLKKVIERNSSLYSRKQYCFVLFITETRPPTPMVFKTIILEAVEVVA